MNRELLKKAIKKLVLQEITMNTNGVGTTDTLPDDKAVAALKKSVKDANVEKRPGSSNVTATAQKHQVALSRISEDSFDVLSITNGSDRRTAKGLSLEDANEFIKKHAKETEKSYVDQARAKSVNSGKEIKKEEDKKAVAGGSKESDTDAMEDADEETQIDIADDNDVKAEEKGDKDIAPIDDDISAQMGGALVDKIEKIIDRVLKAKDKVEPKSAYLKTDKKMESPDKLSVKVKETPALKASKK
jgi:hypothetical protein